jgi:sugar phosphate isomerase/epimerase
VTRFQTDRVQKRRFGVSTRLYQRQRLGRDQLLEIAAHRFEAVELVAARAHLDYQNPAAVADLQQWLGEAGLELASVEVPADEDADAALLIARRLPLKLLVLRATTPRDTAKMVERLAAAAAPLGVALAIDSTSMTPIGSLVHFVESGVDVPIGICLDFAAAAVGGGLVDTLEEVAEHLALARLPIESAIDWASAMTTAQKIGYEGPLIFDAEPRGPAKEALKRAQETRRRMERMLAL